MSLAVCHRIDHGSYCDRVAVEAARFVEAVRDLDPTARVPTCPDWSVADLMEHLGTVHRWCANQVEVLTPARIPSTEMELGVPSEPDGFPAWLSDGADRMVAVLRSGDPDAAMWAWGSDQHVRFWSRRMLHETAVHRADAEFAGGGDPSIDQADAIDGVDEFLDNLPHARRFAPRVAELAGASGRLLVRCTDKDVAWTIALGPGGFEWDHTDDSADVTVEGTASDLLLFIYGRLRPTDTTRFKVAGDGNLLDFWIERSSI